MNAVNAIKAYYMGELKNIYTKIVSKLAYSITPIKATKMVKVFPNVEKIYNYFSVTIFK